MTETYKVKPTPEGVSNPDAERKTNEKLGKKVWQVKEAVESEEFPELNTAEAKAKLEAEERAREGYERKTNELREEFNRRINELKQEHDERKKALEDKIAKLEAQISGAPASSGEKAPSKATIPRIEAKEVFAEALERFPFLRPNHDVGEVGGANIFLSDIMTYESRDVALVYTQMEEEDSMKPHLFYRSKSSALWRFAPWQRGDGWIYKSNYGEDAINAPIELQKTMSELADSQQDKADINMDVLLNITDDPDIPKDHNGDISKFVSERKVNGKNSLTPPLRFIGPTSSGNRFELPDPEECILSEQESPDYEHELFSWTTDNEQYGKLTARCFESKDKSLKFLIFKNHEGRAWIGAVEPADAKTSQIGINKEFIQPGALTTPLYEYHHKGALQDGRKGGGYWGNPNDRKGNYTGMDFYLNRIPALQEFNRRYEGK